MAARTTRRAIPPVIARSWPSNFSTQFGFGGAFGAPLVGAAAAGAAGLAPFEAGFTSSFFSYFFGAGVGGGGAEGAVEVAVGAAVGGGAAGALRVCVAVTGGVAARGGVGGGTGALGGGVGGGGVAEEVLPTSVRNMPTACLMSASLSSMTSMKLSAGVFWEFSKNVSQPLGKPSLLITNPVFVIACSKRTREL